jgi:hypothetical protein
MKNRHCLYILQGRGADGKATWRVGTTARPNKRPQESYRENRDCLGKPEHVKSVCGLDKETALAVEKLLIDALGAVKPDGRCNIIKR